ncbi:MAG: transketolase C-terminal domain-containing protein [Candidatus Pacebacteria bacterium]|nr:transketolase C-terminal domain-containing protein [Candidatus Paceibacterota bacterium]
MTHIDPKLNPKIFDTNADTTIEQTPIRSGFGEGLVKAGEENEKVVGLCADLIESTKMLAFQKKFPERFVELGVAEQNLASVASGMAAMGKIPFISSYAMFSPGRNWEQVRTTICYNNVPVKIAGSHAGVSVGPDGGTHQAIEDMALTRVIPNMVVISPCDAVEARKATIACARTSQPTYLRLAREKTPVITTEETPFEIGKAQVFFQPDTARANAIALAKINSQSLLKKSIPAKPEKIVHQIDVGIIATGALVYKAIRVAKHLEGQGVAVKVLNLSTIKPLDVEAVTDLARESGAIVTVEEHQIAGGMGSAVAECLASTCPVPMEFIGVRDQFGQSGTPEELLEHYEMGERHITKAVKKILKRK